MLELEPIIIILDTEYTAWEGSAERDWSGPNEYKEIIEIGAVKVETKNFQEIETLQIFVKPRKNPELSDYIKKFTGISQSNIDTEGKDLAEALEKLSGWSKGVNFFSWGNEGEVVQGNCDLYGVKNPIEFSHFHDIRPIFKKHGIETKNFMSSTIVRAFGLEPSRTGHRAINDARTILDGLRELQKLLQIVELRVPEAIQRRSERGVG